MKSATPQQKIETPSAEKPTLEQISRRAYDIWASEGRPGGCELEHWLRAERELKDDREPNSSQPRTTRRSNGSSVSKNAEWCPW